MKSFGNYPWVLLGRLFLPSDFDCKFERDAWLLTKIGCCQWTTETLCSKSFELILVVDSPCGTVTIDITF